MRIRATGCCERSPRGGCAWWGISLWVWAMLVVLVVYDYVYENVYMFTFPGGTPRGAHTERTAGGCPVKSVCPCVPPAARAAARDLTCYYGQASHSMGGWSRISRSHVRLPTC